MIRKEKSIELPWFSTKPQIHLLSKQDRTQLVSSTELTTEHVFENVWGNCPVASPPDCGIS